jgi:hypothetical protein
MNSWLDVLRHSELVYHWLEKVYLESAFLSFVHSVSPAFRHFGQFGAADH